MESLFNSKNSFSSASAVKLEAFTLRPDAAAGHSSDVVEFKKPLPIRVVRPKMKPITVEAAFEYAKMEGARIEIKQTSNPNFTQQPKLDETEKTKTDSVLVIQRNRSFRRRMVHAKNALYKFPKTVEKRNARERTRVHTVNQAFLLLKYRIPAIKANTKRVSKLKILRAAINYIYALSDVLESAPPPVIQSNPVLESPVRSSATTGMRSVLDHSLGFMPCPQPAPIVPKPIVDLAANNPAFAAAALPYMNYENQLYQSLYPTALQSIQSQVALDQLCHPTYPIMNNLVNWST